MKLAILWAIAIANFGRLEREREFRKENLKRVFSKEPETRRMIAENFELAKIIFVLAVIRGRIFLSDLISMARYGR